MKAEKETLKNVLPEQDSGSEADKMRSKEENIYSGR